MRQTKLINTNWYFSKTAKGVEKATLNEFKEESIALLTYPGKMVFHDCSDWVEVNVPHTWNGTDGQDGGNDYHRGTCYYLKNVPGELFEKDKINYLEFDGVNSSATVYWNGKQMAIHHGGYSLFRVKIEDIQETNLLIVAADNAPNDFVYPQNADFTFYGGIYRDVKIVSVDKNHFVMDFWGAPGIKVTPIVDLEKSCAAITVESFVELEEELYTEVKTEAVENGSTKAKNDLVKIRTTILDGVGNVICENVKTKKEDRQKTGTIEVEKKNKKGTPVAKAEFVLENPHLWNGLEDPYLYSAKAELIVNGEVCDMVETHFGCRTCEFDAEKGFFLNGKAYPLRGVSRHQDRPEVGNALTKEMHEEDLELILEMGANTIRLAHYQHAQYFYDLCDKKGVVIWAEIPYITTHMPKGRENTITQMKELVYQNYNHPCIVTWGLSNEITANGAREKTLLENHYELNKLVHKLDATRPTTMAVITMCAKEEEIVHISDIVSYNHYFGWYGGSVDMYGTWFDDFHKKYPHKPIGISEYGCEALDWHSSEPVQGDYTEEYQAYYHEELIKMIDKRPYLWATHVWNMFDFAADARAEGGENGMNHKGLVTFDRKYKKDAFYAYKAWLSKEPFVHICGKRYVDRVEDVTKVTVYSNLPEVELLINGNFVEKKVKSEYPFFYFYIKNSGDSVITVRSGEFQDEAHIRKVEVFNEDYRMKEEGEVLNWFEITAPAGYYSINDSIGDIMKSAKGTLLLGVILKSMLDRRESDSKKEKKASENQIKLNKNIIQMVQGFTVKRALSMVGMMGMEALSKEEMLEINRKLNKIKKRKK